VVSFTNTISESQTSAKQAEPVEPVVPLSAEVLREMLDIRVLEALQKNDVRGAVAATLSKSDTFLPSNQVMEEVGVTKNIFKKHFQLIMILMYSRLSI